MGILRRALGPRVLGLVFATAVTTAAVESHAQQPNAVDRETARARMEQGEGARERGDLRAALRAFEEADALMRVPSTGLEVARTQVALGMLLEAKETLARVKAIPVRPGEPPPFVAARRQADQLAADVANRTPTLAVIVKSVDGATPRVSIDGENVPLAAAETPRKINPGTHAVVVSHGTVERREEVKLTESDKRTVTIDLALPAPARGGAGGSGGGETRDGKDAGEVAAGRRGETPSGGGGSKALIYGGFGVAIVGASVGAVTGILSFGKVDDIKTKCGGATCPPQYQSDVDSAKSLGTIATIAFVIGGLGAAAGVVGLVLPGNEEKPASTSARGVTARPTFGLGFVGLDGRF